MHEYIVDDQIQRRTPEFRRVDGPFFFRLGIFAFLFALPLTISILFTHNRTFLHWIGFIVFLLVDLILFAVFLFAFGRALAWLRQKRTWAKTSASAQTTIAQRKMNIHEGQGYPWADGWSLGLATIVPQLAVIPNESVVWVNITEAQYKKYADRNTVCIHYSVEDPFVFLLEDEV